MNRPRGSGLGQDQNVRYVGNSIKVHLAKPRARFTWANIVVFAVVPSLFCWAIIFLTFAGNFAGALQHLCAALASGYVGWCLREVL